MDPYLELFWNDVHGKLVPYIADELNEQLPSHFRAAMQERVVISEVDQSSSSARYPDVAVLESPVSAGAGVAVLPRRTRASKPELLAWRAEPHTEYSLEILDQRFGNAVVTAIEVLSPENKRPGDGMEQFKQKQDEYRRAGVSRVQIDLLRSGRRMFEYPESMLSAKLVKPYYVSVCRGWQKGLCELYAIDLREPLPVIAIPLRQGEPDVDLDLQPLIEHVYRTGRFPIDYNGPCSPPLEGVDAVWARQWLTEHAPAGRPLV
jgi:hypothetical protein